jgi:inner membrane protein
MPSPIVHSVSGYAIARLFPSHRSLGSGKGFGNLAYGVFIAVLPDLDLIPQLLTGEKYHRGASHSLTFAIATAVVAYGVGYLLTKRYSLSLLLSTLLLYGSHLVLDLFTAGSAGIQLFWPFTTAYFKSPVPLFPSTYWSKPLFQHPGHFIFIGVELSFSIALLALVWLCDHKRAENKSNQITRKVRDV